MSSEPDTAARTGGSRDANDGLVSLAYCLIGALHAPLLLWAKNQTFITRPIVPLAIYAALGLILFLILHRFGRAGAHIGLLVGFLVTSGGQLVEALPGGEWSVALVLGVGVLIVWRLGRSGLAKGFFLATAIYLLLGPVQAFASAKLSWGESTLPSHEALDFGGQRQGADLVIVVIDALGGPLSLSQEFEFDLGETLDQLNSAAFQTPLTFASDSITQTSVSSTLLMQYSVTDRTSLNSATIAGLRDIVAGNNELVRIFRGWGYEVTMVEAGWGGSRCGAGIDNCIRAPVFDDALSAITANSIVAGKLQMHLGSGFTQGTLATRNWLIDELPNLLNNGRGDLVFTHVMAPHPPLFLDPNCEIRSGGTHSGLGFWRTGDTQAVIDQRKAAYLDQVRCVESVIAATTLLLSDSTSVIFMGDHGPDSLNQLSTEPRDWTMRQIRERQNMFFAARLPAGCVLPERTILPNVIRAAVACFGAYGPQPLENRVFLTLPDRGAKVFELPQSQVAELLSTP